MKFSDGRPQTGMNAHLQSPPHAASLPADLSLFLDFDGTLVALADTPDAIIVHHQTRVLLADLKAALRGRLAIISGRDVASLRRGFGIRDIIIAGSHGAEIAIPGAPIEAAQRTDSLDQALRALETFAASHQGVVIEQKSLGIGLHYRLAPAQENACSAMAQQISEQYGFAIQRGKMLFELRADSANKGAALTRLMQRDPFCGTTPIFIGDDVTDEDGFRAAADHGGMGMKVGEITIGDQAQTSAGYTLADIDAVHGYLRKIVAQYKGQT